MHLVKFKLGFVFLYIERTTDWVFWKPLRLFFDLLHQCDHESNTGGDFLIFRENKKSQRL